MLRPPLFPLPDKATPAVLPPSRVRPRPPPAPLVSDETRPQTTRLQTSSLGRRRSRASLSSAAAAPPTSAYGVVTSAAGCPTRRAQPRSDTRGEGGSRAPPPRRGPKPIVPGGGARHRQTPGTASRRRRPGGGTGDETSRSTPRVFLPTPPPATAPRLPRPADTAGVASMRPARHRPGGQR